MAAIRRNVQPDVLALFLAGAAGLLAGPPTSRAAVSFVQAADSTDDSGSSSIAQSFNSSNIAGDLIIVAVSWGDNPAPSVSASDSLGNAYFLATTDWDANHNQGLAIFYAPNIQAGANTVTINFGQVDEYRRIIVSEYSGAAADSPLDAAANYHGSGTTAPNGITSSAATTTANGDLIFGAVMDDSGNFGSIAAGSGFTERATLNNTDTASEDSTQTTAGPIAATFTFSLADDYLAQMAAFRSAVPGGRSAPVLSSLSCAPTTVPSSETSNCTVTLDGPALSGGSSVALSSSNNRLLSVPGSVTVPAGSSSADFSATAGSVSRNRRVTLTATDGGSQSLQLLIVPASSEQLAVATTTLPDGRVQTSYSAVLSATGGTSPYSWSIAAGQLPSGLGLASSGAISGTPTVAGTSSFAVEVTDSTGATASANLSITIASALSGSQVTLNTVTLLILNNQSGIPQTIPATQGNLIIVSWVFGPGDYVTAITDNQGNAYAPVSQSCDSTWGAGVCGIWYAANARPGVTSITITSAINSSFDDANVYDVSGAASSPLDTATISGDQTSNVPFGPPITPSTSGGIIVSNVGVWSNTITSVDSPFVFDPQDQNNGWAHVTNNSTGTYSPVWHISGGAYEWAGISAAFKAAGQ